MRDSRRKDGIRKDTDTICERRSQDRATIAAFPRTNSVFNAKKINKNKNPRRHPGYRKERKQDCSFLNYSLIYFYTLPKKFLFFYFVFLFRGAPAN